MFNSGDHKTNYFFISSPLHFFIACNLAISMAGDTNIAVIIARNKSISDVYSSFARKLPDVFARTHTLVPDASKNKISNNRLSGEKITALLHAQAADVIFTGNDRRFEFQFAMQQAKRMNSQVTGAYMDDGAVSYLGHKSMSSLQHRYLDPFFKKIIYGRWWQNALTNGTSAWIDDVYLAFPELAHPLLKEKALHAINHAVFLSDRFKNIVDRCLEEYREILSGIKQYKVILTLPHESFYLQQADLLSTVNSILLQTFAKDTIAIKAHPRSTHLDILHERFPGLSMLDNQLGLEILVPRLSGDCLVMGDISSTLLTTKWLRPDLNIIAVQFNPASSQGLDTLFRQLQIPVIDIHLLKRADTNKIQAMLVRNRQNQDGAG